MEEAGREGRRGSREVDPLGDGDAAGRRAAVLLDTVLGVHGEVRQEVLAVGLGLLAWVDGRVPHHGGAGAHHALLLQQLEVRDEELLPMIAQDEVDRCLHDLLALRREELGDAIGLLLDRAHQDLDPAREAGVLDDLGGDGREERVDLHANEERVLRQVCCHAQRAVAAVGADLQASVRHLAVHDAVDGVAANAPGVRARHGELVRPEGVHGA
mmetsp:Transcript_6506/g.13888  ORF Transcript_6506/g.13888 Transcript_6506/m.13888 type:complete len:213 (-) Transcript_6506:361-999(-)